MQVIFVEGKTTLYISNKFLKGKLKHQVQSRFVAVIHFLAVKHLFLRVTTDTLL